MKKILLLGVMLSNFVWVLGCVTPEQWPEPGPGDPVPPAPDMPFAEPGPLSQAFELPRGNGPLELSVEAAVVLALASHPDVRIRQLNPVIAGLFEKIEQGAYDPELFARAAVEKESDPDPSDETTTLVFEAGVRQALPWGTTLEAALSHDDVRSGGDDPGDSVRLGLSVTQALLRGAGPAVNLAAIRISRLETLASQYELAGFVQALAGETETAYWHYVLAQKEHTIVENALAVSKSQAREVREKIAVGILPENEMAAASAEVARQNQALIASMNLVEERRLRLLRFFHTGGPDHLDRPVAATSSPDTNPAPVTGLQDRIALAMKYRPDLSEAGLRLRQGKLSTLVTRNGVLPELDFFMDLGISGYGRDLGNSIQNLDKDSYDVTAGLEFSRFFKNRAARARHKVQVATLEQAELAVDNLKLQIELEVRLAMDAADTARRLIAAARTTREFVSEAVRAEEERFKAGTSTALQVARVRRDLLVSRIAEARAVINFRIALIRLFSAEGSLLWRRGLVAGQN